MGNGSDAFAQIGYPPIDKDGQKVIALLRTSLGHASLQHPRLDHQSPSHSKVFSVVTIQCCAAKVNHTPRCSSSLSFFSLLQREVLEVAVYFGLSSAVNEARRLFSQWMSGNLLLPPDIRDIVYSTGILLFILISL